MQSRDDTGTVDSSSGTVTLDRGGSCHGRDDSRQESILRFDNHHQSAIKTSRNEFKSLVRRRALELALNYFFINAQIVDGDGGMIPDDLAGARTAELQAAVEEHARELMRQPAPSRCLAAAGETGGAEGQVGVPGVVLRLTLRRYQYHSPDASFTRRIAAWLSPTAQGPAATISSCDNKLSAEKAAWRRESAAAATVFAVFSPPEHRRRTAGPHNAPLLALLAHRFRYLSPPHWAIIGDRARALHQTRVKIEGINGDPLCPEREPLFHRYHSIIRGGRGTIIAGPGGSQAADGLAEDPSYYGSFVRQRCYSLQKGPCSKSISHPTDCDPVTRALFQVLNRIFEEHTAASNSRPSYNRPDSSEPSANRSDGRPPPIFLFINHWLCVNTLEYILRPDDVVTSVSVEYCERGAESDRKSDDNLSSKAEHINSLEPSVVGNYEVLYDRQALLQSLHLIGQDLTGVRRVLDHLIIVNKNGTMPTVPSGRYFRNTLLSILKRDYQVKLSSIEGDEMTEPRGGATDWCCELRPFHRLDKETSGLVVFGTARATIGTLQSTQETAAEVGEASALSSSPHGMSDNMIDYMTRYVPHVLGPYCTLWLLEQRQNDDIADAESNLAELGAPPQKRNRSSDGASQDMSLGVHPRSYSRDGLDFVAHGHLAAGGASLFATCYKPDEMPAASRSNLDGGSVTKRQGRSRRTIQKEYIAVSMVALPRTYYHPPDASAGAANLPRISLSGHPLTTGHIVLLILLGYHTLGVDDVLIDDRLKSVSMHGISHDLNDASSPRALQRLCQCFLELNRDVVAVRRCTRGTPVGSGDTDAGGRGQCFGYSDYELVVSLPIGRRMHGQRCPHGQTFKATSVDNKLSNDDNENDGYPLNDSFSPASFTFTQFSMACFPNLARLSPVDGYRAMDLPRPACSVLRLLIPHSAPSYEGAAAGPLGLLTWLSVQLLTGRTHQVRVHLAGLGLPVLGDKLYRSPLMPVGIAHAREGLADTKSGAGDPLRLPLDIAFSDAEFVANSKAGTVPVTISGYRYNISRQLLHAARLALPLYSDQLPNDDPLGPPAILAVDASALHCFDEALTRVLE